jgi:C4-dicarboxylate-specific signal transduction histidine kinase
VFKNLPTSVKLLVLCATFIISAGVPIYELVREKHIAIDFARKELVGSRHLSSVRGVYNSILASERAVSHETILPTLAAVQTEADDRLQIAQAVQTLADSLRKLPLQEPESAQIGPPVVDALSKAQVLAARIGDASNLALDPDLDSYYVQAILVRKLPTLLGRLAELQQAFQADIASGASTIQNARLPILISLVRSVADEVSEDLKSAYRGNADGRLERAVDAEFAALMTSVASYVGAVQASATGVDVRDAAVHTRFHVGPVQAALRAWSVGQIELDRLLHQRIDGLLGRMRAALFFIAAFVALSIVIAFLTHRHIAGPLKRLEAVASRVRQSKDYSLRVDYRSKDEIGRVTGAFNDMLSELAAARERETAERVELARVSRLTTMGEMAASIAHEVNQPLSAIVSNASAGLRWLANAAPDLDKVRTVLERVVRDGHRASEVIASVRSMFNRDAPGKERLRINGLIEEVLVLFRGEFRSKQIVLQTELAKDDPAVLANRVQLQQVLMNLITNAVDAMHGTRDRPRVLQIRTEAGESGQVLIAVEDSGPGVAAADLDRVFDPFFTTKAAGMGLGLSVCRSIVEAHGGSLRVSPGAQHGTIFQFALPTSNIGGADEQPS